MACLDTPSPWGHAKGGSVTQIVHKWVLVHMTTYTTTK